MNVTFLFINRLSFNCSIVSMMRYSIRRIQFFENILKLLSNLLIITFIYQYIMYSNKPIVLIK